MPSAPAPAMPSAPAPAMPASGEVAPADSARPPPGVAVVPSRHGAPRSLVHGKPALRIADGQQLAFVVSSPRRLPRHTSAVSAHALRLCPQPRVQQTVPLRAPLQNCRPGSGALGGSRGLMTSVVGDGVGGGGAGGGDGVRSGMTHGEPRVREHR